MPFNDPVLFPVPKELRLNKQNFEDAKLRFLLVFPQPFHEKTVSQTMRVIYNCVREFAGFDVYFDWMYSSREGLVRYQNGKPSLFGFESQRPMQDFDIVGTSFSFLPTDLPIFMKALKDVPRFNHLHRERVGDTTSPFMVCGGQPVDHLTLTLGEIFDAVYLGLAEHPDGTVKMFREALAMLAEGKTVKANKMELIERLCKRSPSEKQKIGWLYPQAYTYTHRVEDGVLKFTLDGVKDGYPMKVRPNVSVDPETYGHYYSKHMPMPLTARPDKASVLLSYGCIGANSCSFSVSSGTHVWTDKGIVTVDSLRPLVPCKVDASTLDVVVDAFQTAFEPEYQYRFSSGLSLYGSLDHKFLVLDPATNTLTETRGRDLKQGDIMLRKRGTSFAMEAGQDYHFRPVNHRFVYDAALLDRETLIDYVDEAVTDDALHFSDEVEANKAAQFVAAAGFVPSMLVHNGVFVVKGTEVSTAPVEIGYEAFQGLVAQAKVTFSAYIDAELVKFYPYPTELYESLTPLVFGWQNPVGITQVNFARLTVFDTHAILAAKVSLPATLSKGVYPLYQLTGYPSIEAVTITADNYTLRMVDGLVSIELLTDLAEPFEPSAEPLDVEIVLPYTLRDGVPWKPTDAQVQTVLSQGILGLLTSAEFTMDTFVVSRPTDKIVQMFDLTTRDTHHVCFDSLLTHQCHEGHFYGVWREVGLARLWELMESAKREYFADKLEYHSINSINHSRFDEVLALSTKHFYKVATINYRGDSAAYNPDLLDTQMAATRGNRGFTLSVEGVSERIRSGMLNKNLYEEEIVALAKSVIAASFSRLKMMLILTGWETPEDFKEFEDLMDSLVAYAMENNYHFNMFASFVRLEHTPFTPLYHWPREIAWQSYNAIINNAEPLRIAGPHRVRVSSPQSNVMATLINDLDGVGYSYLIQPYMDGKVKDLFDREHLDLIVARLKVAGVDLERLFRGAGASLKARADEFLERTTKHWFHTHIAGAPSNTYMVRDLLEHGDELRKASKSMPYCLKTVASQGRLFKAHVPFYEIGKNFKESLIVEIARAQKELEAIDKELGGVTATG